MAATEPSREHEPPRHVLVTGGGGFIGSHLVERLLADHPDLRVTVVDDFSTGRPENLAALDADRLVVHAEPLADALEGPLRSGRFDRLYHLAAAVGVRLILERPIETIERNIVDTARLLRFAGERSLPVLVASSSEVYGKSDRVPFAEDDDVVYGSSRFTRWSYACTKLVDEHLALAHARTDGLPVVLARFFNTVGPRQVGTYGMVLPRFVRAALADEPIEVYGDGSQARCFCDVRDVVRVLPRLLDDPACRGRTYNVGSDRLITIGALARLVVDTLGSRSPIRLVPYAEAYGEGFEDLPARQPDLARIRAAAGWVPEIPLERTIRDIAASIENAHTSDAASSSARAGGRS